MTFNDFELEAKVIKAVTELGFEEPTPIQMKAIPVALTGRDLIGQAQTGTGKTAAFGIPLINKINITSDKIEALILTPTRELAIQVSEEIGKLSRFKGVRTLPIYGGQEIGRQIRALKKYPHIIIGTPGRLLDHINRKTIRLDEVKTVILDEAFSKSSPSAAGRIIEALRIFCLHPIFVTPNKEIGLLRQHTRRVICVQRLGKEASLASITWEKLDAFAPKP